MIVRIEDDEFVDLTTFENDQNLSHSKVEPTGQNFRMKRSLISFKILFTKLLAVGLDKD
jgi:hypothetical protein